MTTHTANQFSTPAGRDTRAAAAKDCGYHDGTFDMRPLQQTIVHVIASSYQVHIPDGPLFRSDHHLVTAEIDI